MVRQYLRAKLEMEGIPGSRHGDENQSAYRADLPVVNCSMCKLEFKEKLGALALRAGTGAVELSGWPRKAIPTRGEITVAGIVERRR